MNKRGAEMVEYAIVLACIAAVGAFFFMEDGHDAWTVIDDKATPLTFKAIMQDLWSRIGFGIEEMLKNF